MPTTKDPRKIGLESEKRSMKRRGVKQVVGSGSWVGSKGDGRENIDHPDVPDFLVEHKNTTKKSYRFTLDILQKIYREARDIGRAPQLQVVFSDERGQPLESWICIKERDWEIIKEALEDAKHDRK